MSQKKAHLFLSLSRKGWGEATLGIRIAREMCRAGERVIYFGHNSARPLFSGVPFEYEEVSDDTIGLLEMMLDEMVGSGEVSCIILCDFFTCTGVLSDFGTDSRFLSRYDIPLVVLDIWDSARTGFVMDFFLGKRKEIAQWLGEVPYRLIPVPIAHSENRLGAYRCLPEPVRLASKVRKHVRRNLGLTDQDRAILFGTAGWQQTQ